MSASESPLHIIKRQDWTKRTMPIGAKDMGDVEWITVHRTETPDVDNTLAETRLRGIEEFHAQKGWGGIAYHFLIARDGRVFEGRPIALRGCHVRDANRGNIGVALFGDKGFTAAQHGALIWLVDSLQSRFPTTMKPGRLRCHNEWPTVDTDCPGKLLQEWVKTIRAKDL